MRRLASIRAPLPHRYVRLFVLPKAAISGAGVRFPRDPCARVYRSKASAITAMTSIARITAGGTNHAAIAFPPGGKEACPGAGPPFQMLAQLTSAARLARHSWVAAYLGSPAEPQQVSSASAALRTNVEYPS